MFPASPRRRERFASRGGGYEWTCLRQSRDMVRLPPLDPNLEGPLRAAARDHPLQRDAHEMSSVQGRRDSAYANQPKRVRGLMGSRAGGAPPGH